MIFRIIFCIKRRPPLVRMKVLQFIPICIFLRIRSKAVNMKYEPIFNFRGWCVSPSRLRHRDNKNSIKWDMVLPEWKEQDPPLSPLCNPSYKETPTQLFFTIYVGGSRGMLLSSETVRCKFTPASSLSIFRYYFPQNFLVPRHPRRILSRSVSPYQYLRPILPPDKNFSYTSDKLCEVSALHIFSLT